MIRTDLNELLLGWSARNTCAIRDPSLRSRDYLNHLRGFILRNTPIYCGIEKKRCLTPFLESDRTALQAVIAGTNRTNVKKIDVL
jgi:hypothetical protein